MIMRQSLMNISAMSTSKNRKVRLGIISSAGGSVLKELARLRDVSGLELRVVTDRACGTENICDDLGIVRVRIEEGDNEVFSKKAAAYFSKESGVEGVLLFFTRVVGRELFGKLPTFNIHPSLLPAFKGFRPLEQAANAKEKVIGATLHLVDEHVDGGPIVAQVSSPAESYDVRYLEKLSFLQKTFLAYFLVEALANGNLPRNKLNPAITNPAVFDIFREIEEENGLKI